MLSFPSLARGPLVACAVITAMLLSLIPSESEATNEAGRFDRGAVSGVVVGSDGSPVASALVDLIWYPNDGGPSVHGLVSADDQGRFFFEYGDPGTYYVTGEPPSGSASPDARTWLGGSFLRRTSQSIQVTSGMTTDITINLKQGGRIAGQIKRGSTGRQHSVEILPVGGGRDDTFFLETDANGYYSHPVMPGSYNVLGAPLNSDNTYADPTWFGGTTDKRQAQQLSVEQGVVSNADIRLYEAVLGRDFVRVGNSSQRTLNVLNNDGLQGDGRKPQICEVQSSDPTIRPYILREKGQPAELRVDVFYKANKSRVGRFKYLNCHSRKPGVVEVTIEPIRSPVVTRVRNVSRRTAVYTFRNRDRNNDVSISGRNPNSGGIFVVYLSRKGETVRAKVPRGVYWNAVVTEHGGGDRINLASGKFA